MNKLVIIGNGFDLAHGLPTSYKDFLLWYINNNIVKNIPKTNHYFSNNENNFNDLKFNSIVDFKSYINQNTNINPNFEHFFIKNLITTTVINNWVDVEYEYFKMIRLIGDSITNNQISKTTLKNLRDLNIHFDKLKFNLEKYLETIKSNVKDSINDNILEHFYDMKINNKDEDYYFLNFNYTETILNYVNHFNLDQTNVNFIHGKIKDKKNPIVFGYGDESNNEYIKIEGFNENEFTKYFKSFRYLFNNNYTNLFEFLKTKSFDVHIMGHSCGISDKILFSNIFNHKNFNRITLYYYKFGINEFENDFFEKTQDLSRHFDINSKHRMRLSITPYENSKPLVEFK